MAKVIQDLDLSESDKSESLSTDSQLNDLNVTNPLPKSDKAPIKLFRKVKLNNEEYSIGDDVVALESIICKVKVLHLKDYQNLSAVNQSIYYTRAKYDVIQNRLFPPFYEWERMCKCKKPLNPDMLCICCEMCEKWFHPYCFGIKETDVGAIEAFYCDVCKQKRKRDKKKKSKKPKKSHEEDRSCYFKKIKEDF